MFVLATTCIPFHSIPPSLIKTGFKTQKGKNIYFYYLVQFQNMNPSVYVYNFYTVFFALFKTLLQYLRHYYFFSSVFPMVKDNLKIRSASSLHIKEKRKVRSPCNSSPVSNFNICTGVARKCCSAGLEYSFEI